jgi:hypothetical protein
MSKWDHVYQYAVNGLPVGEEALIAENQDHWQFLRISQGEQGKWTREYEGPDRGSVASGGTGFEERENCSFAPLRLAHFQCLPTACAVGCILTPLCG